MLHVLSRAWDTEEKNKNKQTKKNKQKKNLSTHEGSNPRFADFCTRMLYYGAAESLKVSHTINQEYNQFSRALSHRRHPAPPRILLSFPDTHSYSYLLVQEHYTIIHG